MDQKSKMDQNSKMDQKSKTENSKSKSPKLILKIPIGLKSKMDFNNPKSRSPKPKTHWRKTYQMDLESKLNEWWVRGATNLKRKRAAIEKTQKLMKKPEPLHVKIRQNTTCLICDKFFEEIQQCIWHIKIIHVLEKPVKNWHYQTISCSKFKDPILQKVKMGKISPKTIPKEKPQSTTRTPK